MDRGLPPAGYQRLVGRGWRDGFVDGWLAYGFLVWWHSGAGKGPGWAWLGGATPEAYSPQGGWDQVKLHDGCMEGGGSLLTDVSTFRSNAFIDVRLFIRWRFK